MHIFKVRNRTLMFYHNSNANSTSEPNVKFTQYQSNDICSVRLTWWSREWFCCAPSNRPFDAEPVFQVEGVVGSIFNRRISEH